MLITGDVLRRLCEGRELLRQDDRALSVKEIAQQIRISPFHFIRQFDSVFGVTPHQYRIRMRLDRAKVLLARGEHTVTEVCMEVGFSSLGSFSDLFAQRVGSTPSDYRRHARAMVAVAGRLPPALFPGCLSLMGQLPACAFRNFQEASFRHAR